MTLKFELEARAAKLEEILSAVNLALAEKGAAPADTLDGLAQAIGGISAAPTLQDKAVSENGTYTADSGYDGLGTVTVNVEGGAGVDMGVAYNAVDEDGKPTAATVYGCCVYAHQFREQTALTRVDFAGGGGSGTIGQYAFQKCSALASMELPAWVTEIESGAFASCTALAEVAWPEALNSIGTTAFSNCQSLALSGGLPEGLETIGTQSFANCYAITALEIPASVKTVGTLAFTGCRSLAGVTFKGTPDSISANAFQNCTALAEINVPWAEGAVADAPWGASSAAINYNYSGE